MESKTLNDIVKSNPLAILMILEGLNRFSHEVAQKSPQDFPKNWIISPEAWISLAQDIQEKLNK